MPLKPARSTILAEMPSWASIRNSRRGDSSRARRLAALPAAGSGVGAGWVRAIIVRDEFAMSSDRKLQGGDDEI